MSGSMLSVFLKLGSLSNLDMMTENQRDGNTSRFVPASEGEVTDTWLQEVLSNVFPNDPIREIHAVRVGVGYGLASRIYRFRWRSGQHTSSVIVKLWNTDSPAGESEAFFYNTFGSVVGTRIPLCYYAAVGPSRNRGVLILEDLDPIEQGDDLQLLSIDRAQLLAQCLAGMHGKWMRSQVLEEVGWLRVPIPWKPEAGWVVSRRALFLERFADRLTQAAQDLLNRIEYAPAVINERLIHAPKTLLHDELHLDNIVFEGEGKPVLLDWAKCARGPAVIDVYKLLFGISQPQDIEQVLNIYLKALEVSAGERFDAVDFHHQLGGVFLLMFAIGTCGIARWQPASQREVAMIDNGIQRTLRALEYWLRHDPALFSFL
jgi:hypothetical protein